MAVPAPSTLTAPPAFTREELSRVTLFREVDLDLIAPLLNGCEVRTLAAGDTLIAIGRPNERLFLLLEGRLSVRLGTPDSDALAHIEPGETVGELSLIDHQPTSASVVAEEPSRVVVLEEDLVWMLSNTSHAVSSNLLFTLVRRMRNGNELIFETRSRLEKFRFHATVDALTGLFNRHWLNQMLPRQMHRAKGSGEALSVLMADLDGFKAYNDQHGHLAGDHALSSIAETVRDKIRPGDMAARFGGEEILVVLPGAPVAGAEVVAERLREAVASTRIEVAGGHTLPSVTASFGIAELAADMTMDEFIAAGDAALYRAKRAGRNRTSR